jgi:hypothetical protein
MDQNRDALEAAAQARADLDVKRLLILKLEKQNAALEAQSSEKERKKSVKSLSPSTEKGAGGAPISASAPKDECLRLD